MDCVDGNWKRSKSGWEIVIIKRFRLVIGNDIHSAIVIFCNSIAGPELVMGLHWGEGSAKSLLLISTKNLASGSRDHYLRRRCKIVFIFFILAAVNVFYFKKISKNIQLETILSDSMHHFVSLLRWVFSTTLLSLYLVLTITHLTELKLDYRVCIMRL